MSKHKFYSTCDRCGLSTSKVELAINGNQCLSYTQPQPVCSCPVCEDFDEPCRQCGVPTGNVGYLKKDLCNLCALAGGL